MCSGERMGFEVNQNRIQIPSLLVHQLCDVELSVTCKCLTHSRCSLNVSSLPAYSVDSVIHSRGRG